MKKDFSKDIKIVYNPEFLTEANSFEDFINPNMQVLGGKWRDCETVEKAYIRHSSVRTVPTFKVDLITASLIKYTINSWLATKVTWFNELHNLHKVSGSHSSWNQFIDMVNSFEKVSTNPSISNIEPPKIRILKNSAKKGFIKEVIEKSGLQKKFAEDIFMTINEINDLETSQKIKTIY